MLCQREADVSVRSVSRWNAAIRSGVCDCSHAQISAASPAYQSQIHLLLRAAAQLVNAAAWATGLFTCGLHTHTHTLWSASHSHYILWFYRVRTLILWFQCTRGFLQPWSSDALPVRLNPFHAAWPPLSQQSASRRLGTPDLYLLLSWTQRKRRLSPSATEDHSLIQESKVTHSYHTCSAFLHWITPPCGYQNRQYTWSSGDIWTCCFMWRELQTDLENDKCNSESACSQSSDSHKKSPCRLMRARVWKCKRLMY